MAWVSPGQGDFRKVQNIGKSFATRKKREHQGFGNCLILINFAQSLQWNGWRPRLLSVEQRESTMSTVFVILLVCFGLAFLMMLAATVFTSASVFRIFNRVLDESAATEKTSRSGKGSTPPGKVLDVVAREPHKTASYKCRHCGALADSTAELSAKGEFKCNYCNAWSSIYEA